MWDPDGRISGVHNDPVCFGAGGIRGTADLALDDDYTDSTNRKPCGRSHLAMPASDARSPSRSREATRVEIDAEGAFPREGRAAARGRAGADLQRDEVLIDRQRRRGMMDKDVRDADTIVT